MNKNKGFIGIGLILVIVLGIAVVGGGAYYLGKNKGENKEINNQNQNLQLANQDQNLPVIDNTQTDCTANSTPSITVLSPNGGEVFTPGQNINIKWSSKCIDAKEKISVSIYKKGAQISQEGSPYGYITTNTGSYNWTIPKDISSNQYEADVGYILTNGNAVYDNSDNLFTINSGSKNISTALPANYINAQEGWPPIIKNSSNTYLCNVGNGNPDADEQTIQKVINGKTYCIHSNTDGAAGSTYHTYTYTTANGSGTKTTTFTLRYMSCGVWRGDGTSKYSNCQTEQSNFTNNIDNIIDSLM